MSKHTYRPDAKGAAERVLGRLADRLTGATMPLDIGASLGATVPFNRLAPPMLRVEDLSAIVGGALDAYHLRFDHLDVAADLCRPVLVGGDGSSAVDVFIRRGLASGEA